MGNNVNRHIRMDEATWTRAQTRATEEGTTISAVVREFCVAYGKGQIPSRFANRKEDETS